MVRLHSLLLSFLLFTTFGVHSTLWAGESATADEGRETEKVVQVPASLNSPRATMETFLQAMDEIKEGKDARISDAVTTLDLSAVNPLLRKERGSDLAWILLDVIDRTQVVNLRRIPARTEGAPYLFKSYKNGTVKITRQDDGRWLFDRQTLDDLPTILDEVLDRKRVSGKADNQSYLPLHVRLRQQMPESLKQPFFVLEHWQWLGLFIMIFIGVIADRLIAFLLHALVRNWSQRTVHEEFREIPAQILRPLGLMAMAIIWLTGINLLGLPEYAMLILLLAVKFLASISGVWAAYRLVDLSSVYLMKRAQRTENKLDDALVPLIPRTLKVFITVIGFVFIAENMDVDISSLLAGLGLGGLAFALAAKDMVQNLFGSITVLMDRTFSVGDWVVIGDVEGSVETIGFRSTRIRTFYNSLVTVPNSKFITAEVDNMGARRFRRLSTKLALTYDTSPDKIEAFCEGIRELIRSHPYMRKDYYQVYLNELSTSSLNVLLYVFWETPEWNTELRERHRFLLDILRLAARLEVEFAFPTQTLYMRQEEGAGDALSEMTQESAHDLGRQQARDIVGESSGTAGKPPPVVFPPVS